MENSNMKIYIWGIGKIAKHYLEKNEINEDELIGFIESKRTKEIFCGKKVFEPQEIDKKDFDYILVCLLYDARDVFEICKKLDFPEEKVFFLDNYEWVTGERMRKMPKVLCNEVSTNQTGIGIQEKFPILFSMSKELEIQANRYSIISRNGYDLVEENDLLQNQKYKSMMYQSDYFRYRSFELTANEISNNKIMGNIAEVGVCTGRFARLLNEKFPKRKLYLFDTFESFDLDEFMLEVEAGRCPENFIDGFVNTSVEQVLEIMPYKENCIVRKGLFPTTTNGLEEEKYAFVSLDVDLEKSTYEGLKYFYPRMSKGGYIFLHDYNNRFLEGVKEAVRKFEEEFSLNLSKVPLADEGGTLVIVKQ